MMAHGIFPSGPFVCVMDAYYICVGAVLVMIGVRTCYTVDRVS